jgi:hypothetical protein
MEKNMLIIILIIIVVVIVLIRGTNDTDINKRNKIQCVVAIILVVSAVLLSDQRMTNETLLATFQSVIIILGFTNESVGMGVLLFDGFFHLTAGTRLSDDSPDWIIARKLYGFKGLPIWAHQLMGVSLMVLVFLKYMGDRDRFGWFGRLGVNVYRYIYPLVGIMLLAGIAVKGTPTAIPKGFLKSPSI